jgi:hypothetical protein
MSLLPVFEAGKCQTVRRHPLEGTSHPLLQAMKNRSGEIPRPFSAQKFAMSHKWFFLSKRGDRSLAVWQSGKFCWFC